MAGEADDPGGSAGARGAAAGPSAAPCLSEGGTTEQRKAVATIAGAAARPTRLVSVTAPGTPDCRATAGPPRSTWIVMVRPSSVASTLPLRSVRYKVAPRASIRASVSGAGWPYGLTAPTETIATFGRTASRKASVDEVRLPWWATLSRSSRGRPRASRIGSISCSMSPASRNRCAPKVPSRTIETLLIDVPPSGGSRGTASRSGHSTRRSIESSRSRSPVERSSGVRACRARSARNA